MTTLKTLFPHGSKDFVELNIGLPYSLSQRDTSDALDPEEKGKTQSSNRITVRITSYRTRLLDLDNAYGGQKFLLDAIKDIGIIPDDSPEEIELQIQQKKVAHKSQEKTLITIQ